MKLHVRLSIIQCGGSTHILRLGYMSLEMSAELYAVAIEGICNLLWMTGTMFSH
jgi:hypothetical protein